MKPFDDYPTDKDELLRPLGGPGNCRNGYGLDLQKRTGQTRCAYCGISLVDDYYHWLLMAAGHVVPTSAKLSLRMPSVLIESLANRLLCCSGCNGFLNRYAVADEVPRDNWSLPDFIALRDRVFVDRKQKIGERRAAEMAIFDRKRWLDPQKNGDRAGSHSELRR